VLSVYFPRTILNGRIYLYETWYAYAPMLNSTAYFINPSHQSECLRKGTEKSLAFLISYFLICSTSKRIFLDRLKKLEQRCHKCVWSSGGICRVNTFFNPVACCLLYKAKGLSAPSYMCIQTLQRQQIPT
jgi:hypothetical protein